MIALWIGSTEGNMEPKPWPSLLTILAPTKPAINPNMIQRAIRVAESAAITFVKDDATLNLSMVVRFAIWVTLPLGKDHST